MRVGSARGVAPDEAQLLRTAARLNPLGFGEFLWSCDEEPLSKLTRSSTEALSLLSDAHGWALLDVARSARQTRQEGSPRIARRQRSKQGLEQGVDGVTALSIAVKIGGFCLFSWARALVSYPGLAPLEKRLRFAWLERAGRRPQSAGVSRGG